MGLKDRYRNLMKKLLPQGHAFTRSSGTHMHTLLDGMAEEPARLHDRADDLLFEMNPTTATELLHQWETVWGLPGKCTGVAGTITERKKALIARMIHVGQQTPGFFIRMAASLGYEIVITEKVSGNPHVWRINVPGEITSQWARAGSARCGDKIRQWGYGMLECAMRQINPAHLDLRISYGDPGVIMTANITAPSTEVTIMLGMEGDGIVEIDWGDGSTSAVSGMGEGYAHTYAAAGSYELTITGEMDRVFIFALMNQPNIVFDWNIEAMTSIRYIITAGNPSAVLNLSSISSCSTLQMLMATGSVSGQLSQIPISSLNHLSLASTSDVTGQLSDLSTCQWVGTAWAATFIPDHPNSLNIGSCPNISCDISEVVPSPLKKIIISGMDLNYAPCVVPATFDDGEYRFTTCGLSDEDVGHILIDFDTGISSGASGMLDLRGNAIPTDQIPGAEEAYQSLIAKGYTVFVEG